MFVPVVTGVASGEGAGMGVFLLLYLVGIPLLIAAVAATALSIHSPNPALLLPTILLWLGAAIVGVTENNLAIVLFSIVYIGAVVRAALPRIRSRPEKDA